MTRVIDRESGETVVQHLYQLSAGGLVDQFVGGHGFTGLVYAYHRTGAELQFACSVAATRP